MGDRQSGREGDSRVRGKAHGERVWVRGRDTSSLTDRQTDGQIGSNCGVRPETPLFFTLNSRDEQVSVASLGRQNRTSDAWDNGLRKTAPEG